MISQDGYAKVLDFGLAEPSLLSSGAFPTGQDAVMPAPVRTFKLSFKDIDLCCSSEIRC